MTDDTDDATTDVQQPYRIGDPVMDAAQGRAMIVLDAPAQTVAEWSDANGYDLQDNYANGKFDPDADEAVVECVYVSDVRSEPSKTYTFPVSRCRLIDAHHADDGNRVAERVELQLLEQLFGVVRDSDAESIDVVELIGIAEAAGVDSGLIRLADELAAAERGEQKANAVGK
jgi:hypothetical protein